MADIMRYAQYINIFLCAHDNRYIREVCHVYRGNILYGRNHVRVYFMLRAIGTIKCIIYYDYLLFFFFFPDVAIRVDHVTRMQMRSYIKLEINNQIIIRIVDYHSVIIIPTGFCVAPYGVV